MALTLTTDERTELERRVRSLKIRAEDARRARVILMLADRDSYSTIEATIPCLPRLHNALARQMEPSVEAHLMRANRIVSSNLFPLRAGLEVFEGLEPDGPKARDRSPIRNRSTSRIANSRVVASTVRTCAGQVQQLQAPLLVSSPRRTPRQCRRDLLCRDKGHPFRFSRIRLCPSCSSRRTLTVSGLSFTVSIVIRPSTSRTIAEPEGRWSNRHRDTSPITSLLVPQVPTPLPLIETTCGPARSNIRPKVGIAPLAPLGPLEQLLHKEVHRRGASQSGVTRTVWVGEVDQGFVAKSKLN